MNDTICTSCDEPCEEAETNEKGECPACASEGKLSDDVPKYTCVDPTHGAILKLTNGVTVVCGAVEDETDCVAGSYVAVYNRDGREIGYWHNDEWRDDPILVMGAALCCAARGLSTDELREQQEEDKVSCEGCGEMFDADELRGELGFCKDCIDEPEHCQTCNGTGEGQVDGSSCTNPDCDGGVIKPKQERDEPEPDDYDEREDRANYGRWGYEG